MGISDDEIARVLKLKDTAEEHYATMARFIEPESERAIRSMQERMQALVDPPRMRALIEQQERIQNLVDPTMLKLMGEHNTIQTALTAPFSHSLIGTNVQSVMGSIAHSLTAANAAISRSLFSTDFLEGIRQITAEHEAQTARINAVVTLVARQLKASALTVDVARFADLFKPVELTGFYESFKHIEEISRAAQIAMGDLRFAALGDLIGVVDPTALQLDTYRLNKSYATYAASIAAAPESVIEAPFMAKVPTLSVYSHARVVRSITTHRAEEPIVEVWTEVQEETTVTIETVLPRVSPALLKSWKGGWATARRRDEDWVRQAAASFRYVLITTLDTVAPKDRVLAAGVDKKYLSQKGELTRLGQVHWLCESIKNKTYRKMVFADLESALKIIDTMSEAVHREDYPEIEEAFGRMSIRAAVALQHLLEVFRTRD